MYKLLFLLIGFLLISCGNQDPNEQLKYLNGYWAIEKVRLPDGTEKEFKISNTVDFIEVTGKNGIRKKVQPKLDGTFETSNNTETFELKIEADSLHLYYTTPYDSWKETVLKAKDSSLVVYNRDKKMYFYKKFTPFNFN